MNSDIVANKEYNPAMHSAEHILNQTMVRVFNCGRAFSAHIEKKKSKCDYKFARDLNELEKKEIENRVNTVISQNLPIYEEYISREEASRSFSLERLPETAKELLRVIKVGEYDSCLCSGKHVKNTSEIGTFKIISSSYNDGVLRLRFKVVKQT